MKDLSQQCSVPEIATLQAICRLAQYGSVKRYGLIEVIHGDLRTLYL